MESYFIEISKNNLRKLYKNIWTETYVFANLIIENKRYDVQIGFRGNQLRKHKKILPY